MAEMLSMMRSLMNDFANQSEKLINVERKLDNVLAAFPTGGLVQHRMYHEKQQLDEKSSDDLKATIIKNVLSGGAWATMVIIAYALWEYFKIKARMS